jgi:hypothetical protein
VWLKAGSRQVLPGPGKVGSGAFAELASSDEEVGSSLLQLVVALRGMARLASVDGNQAVSLLSQQGAEACEQHPGVHHLASGQLLLTPFNSLLDHLSLMHAAASSPHSRPQQASNPTELSLMAKTIKQSHNQSTKQVQNKHKTRYNKPRRFINNQASNKQTMHNTSNTQTNKQTNKQTIHKSNMKQTIKPSSKPQANKNSQTIKQSKPKQTKKTLQTKKQLTKQSQNETIQPHKQ